MSLGIHTYFFGIPHHLECNVCKAGSMAFVLIYLILHTSSVLLRPQMLGWMLRCSTDAQLRLGCLGLFLIASAVSIQVTTLRIQKPEISYGFCLLETLCGILWFSNMPWIVLIVNSSCCHLDLKSSLLDSPRFHCPMSCLQWWLDRPAPSLSVQQLQHLSSFRRFVLSRRGTSLCRQEQAQHCLVLVGFPRYPGLSFLFPCI